MNTSTQNPTENVEQKEVIYWADMFNALERLENNNDFKTVILEGYFKDKAINGVSLLAQDYVKQNGLRSEVMESLIAISALEDFFITIKSLGTPVPDESEDDEG